MNAAGRVSVSPEEITVNTGNMCPLWVGAAQQARQIDLHKSDRATVLVLDILVKKRKKRQNALA